MISEIEFERVRKAVRLLEEHFDNIQLFVSRLDSDGTTSGQYGSGNWFARVGQIQAWLVKSDEDKREEARQEIKDEEL